jgi:hypothetical protein
MQNRVSDPIAFKNVVVYPGFEWTGKLDVLKALRGMKACVLGMPPKGHSEE